MKITRTAIEGVLVIEPRVFEDQRGYFMEIFHQERYDASGVSRVFVQDNLSFSVKGTLRGLHFQDRKPQAKLLQVIAGEIFDVAVDLRPDSATFGQWTGVNLSDANKRQLLIPEGLAHGFCVLSETAHFLYKCADFYDPEDEKGILWSDPGIGIRWPIDRPIISEKDSVLPLLSEVFPNRRPLADHRP